MNSSSPILPRGVSNTRNYQATVANSATAATGTTTTSTNHRQIRRLPNRVQNFSQQSQKSSTSARFSVCSGLSQAFHQQDGDEDDLSMYQFSMDGSVLWARRSMASSSFGGGDTGSQYSLTDDEESVYVDLTGYYDEAVYKDNVPSQEELERIYLEMRAIRLKEEAELQKAMEASRLEHLDTYQQTQRRTEAEMETHQDGYEVQVEEQGYPLLLVEDEEDNYDFDDREEIFRDSHEGPELYPNSNNSTGQTNISVDMTEQSSYSEAEIVGPVRSQNEKKETKKKKSFFIRRLSNFFFPPSKKQDKMVRALENANGQQARAAAAKKKSHQNKDSNNALRKSAPVVQTKAPTPTSRQKRQQMRQSAPVTTNSAGWHGNLIAATEVEC